MSKSFQLSLFIFRRDLRLDDNTGLLKALKESRTVIPCFIFDQRQVGNSNAYKSNNAIQFMIESLQELYTLLKRQDGHLYLFYGKAEQIVKKLVRALPLEAVYVNRDYTPFSIKRDEAIKKICMQHNISFSSSDDALLIKPEEIATQQNTPYAKFTPFFKTASKEKIPKPIKRTKKNFYTKKIVFDKGTSLFKKIGSKPNKDIMVQGGRSNALKILRTLGQFKNYAKKRDFPEFETTLLSAHNKFGTVSIREVFHAIVKKLGSHHLLIKQLYWRDFFTYVAYFSPFVFGQPFYEKYKKLKWSKSKKNFEAWCKGKTGFPIVDAGMRQLNTTGFMHNRVRMLVASFLTKDLHINWLWGERYFAQKLVDYDPAVNNGNWQWCASTGCDAQPYFRIFNPWLQQKKFDPDCVYIKEWVKEVKDMPNAIIHNWYKETKKAIKNYPRPMVDHKKESKIAKQRYKNV